MPDAPILYIESSTPHASLALMRGSQVVGQETFSSDRNHNALLFGPLGRLLALLGEGERLAQVVIGTGPGSYSGTRVGIAAGQGVALVHGCPAVGLSSLLATPAGSAALAIGDARRGSGWYARLHPAVSPDPQLCEVAELIAEIRTAFEAERSVFALESVARLGLPEELAGRITREVPDAVRLAAAWQALPEGERARLLGEPVQPVYLRPPHITEAKAGHPLLRRSGGSAE